jgi:ABC-2 type transport system permease protein
MLGSVFGKTIFEKRWAILIWFGATLVSIFAIMLLFPAIRDTFGSMTATMPAGMENWFGEAAAWQSVDGYAALEVFGQMSLLIIVMAIVFGVALLAGDEGRGTLQTLLTRPVRRGSVFVQKFAVLALMLLVAIVGYYLGALIGCWVLGEAPSLAAFAECALMVYLLALSLGALAFSVGALSGSRVLAGLIVGAYAFLAYFINSLENMSPLLSDLARGSLFHYANAPVVMANGLEIFDIVIFGAVTATSLLVGWLVFRRRDIALR